MMLVKTRCKMPGRVILLMTMLTVAVEVDASCGGYFSTDTGTLHSQNYPLPYNNYEDCTWTIQVDNRRRIRLEFQWPFELESDCDFESVKVFDVLSDGTRHLKGTWCGTDFPPTLMSSTSKIEVEFRSQGFGVKKGFSASWSKIGVASCGGHFIANHGTLHSPNYPFSYNNNDYCMWIISVDVGYSIELKSNGRFRLEDLCGDDDVKVYDVLYSGRKILRGTWCGPYLPLPLVSTTSTIVVVFKTNGYNVHTGFSASWKKTDSSCGGHFNADYGTLHSPNYPLNYNNDDNCIWVISVNDGYRITLEFNAPFNLGYSCNEDSVKVFDVLPSGRRTLRGTWCGSNLPPPLVSTNSTIEVLFTSDEYISYNGFSASWKKTAASCGGNFSTDHGTLHSPNYPSSYNNNDYCVWAISVDYYYSVRLEFNTPFRLDDTCNDDNVKVFDVLSNGTRSLKGTWCGSYLPTPLISLTSTIEVVFKSDGFNVYTGFSASWRKYDGHLANGGWTTETTYQANNSGGEVSETKMAVICGITITVVLCISFALRFFIRKKNSQQARAQENQLQNQPPPEVNQNVHQHTLPPSYEQAVNSTETSRM